MTRSHWISRQEQAAEDKGKPNVNKGKRERERDPKPANRRTGNNREGINHPAVLCNDSVPITQMW